MKGVTFGSWREQVKRWLKFNAVGAIGIVVQLSTLSVFVFGLHVNYLVATALSVEAAILHNFVWHKKFTWADRIRAADERSWARCLKFNLTTGLFSIGGNLLLMRLFVGFFGVNYVAGNILSIATCSIANFVVSDRLVFRRPTLAQS